MAGPPRESLVSVTCVSRRGTRDSKVIFEDRSGKRAPFQEAAHRSRKPVYDRPTRIPRSMHQITHEIPTTTNILDGRRSAVRRVSIEEDPTHVHLMTGRRSLRDEESLGRMDELSESRRPPLAPKSIHGTIEETRSTTYYSSSYYFSLSLFLERWIFEFSTHFEL